VKRLAIVSALACFLSGSADAAPRVVVSIKPLQSLVAAVMAGVGKPALIVRGAGSPHTYALAPSQAALIENADLLFWVGHELEAFLAKPIEALGGKSEVVELLEADGVKQLPLREGGPFEEHEDAHAAGEDRHDEGFDPHVWLDPRNAKVIVATAAAALSRIDPANGSKYAANAAGVAARLDALESEIRATLAPLKGRPFIVFHDAYQYFENRFGVVAAGSITVHPEVAPGAERIAEIRAKVRDLGAVCVFSEPQFAPKLIETVIEGQGARTGVLDPIGAELAQGPDLYFALMRNLAGSLRDCLALPE
jgi:zinc transport system substrate-binding protein